MEEVWGGTIFDSSLKLFGGIRYSPINNWVLSAGQCRAGFVSTNGKNNKHVKPNVFETRST